MDRSWDTGFIILEEWEQCNEYAEWPKGESSIQSFHEGDLKLILPWDFGKEKWGSFLRLISKNKGNKPKETNSAFQWDTLFALFLQNKLGKILFHSHTDCLPPTFLTGEGYLFWWHPYLCQEHSWIVAIPQMQEEEACQVPWALISQAEDGQLDIHSCMRSKLSWIKPLACPVTDKHPEENGISGKRKDAALNWECVHVTWLSKKIYKNQDSMALSP